MTMKLQMTPRIGGTVSGSNGIAVTRTNGIWTVAISTGFNVLSGTAQFRLDGRLAVGIPVPYFQPVANNTVIALDLMPKGAPASAGPDLGVSWFDVCSTDVVAALGINYECLRIGVMAPADGYANITTAQGGTGLIRPLIMQINGGALCLGALDLSFYRDGPDVLAQRRGTNPQGSRLYNTYTDATHFERLGTYFSGNEANITTEAAGGGTVRPLVLQAGGGALGIGASDLALYRDAANTLAQRNGANPQGFRVYNTFGAQTERLSMFFSGNEAFVITEATGGGTQRPLNLQGSVVKFSTVGTTASAANAFLDNAAGNSLLRSTSSLRYKRDVEPLDEKYADAILALTPIWYRSKAPADNPDWSWYGLAAEEVAKIDPRLVHWSYPDNAYEDITAEQDVPEVETVEVTEPTVVIEDGRAVVRKITKTIERQKTASYPLFNADGSPVMVPGKDGESRQAMHSVSLTRKEKAVTGRRLKEGAQLVPDAVQYDRLAVMLLSIVKRQADRVAAIDAKA